MTPADGPLEIDSAPLRVVVCGSGFGRIWMRALADHPGVRLVGLMGRGSKRTERVAAAFDVPCLASDDPFPEADVACVAVRPAQAEVLTAALLDRGLHVLLEHPVSADVLERLAAHATAAGRCLHVNLHFADLPHVNDFLGACRERARREPPRWVLGVCSARTRFSLIDMLVRLFDVPAGATSPSSLHAVPMPAAGSRSLTGSLHGVPVHVTETAYRSARDDGSDQAISHRITVAYPSGTVTLVDTWGPVVSTKPLKGGAVVTAGLPEAVTVRSVRDAALRSAVDALREHAAGGRIPAAQKSSHLSTVAALWDDTGPTPRR